MTPMIGAALPVRERLPLALPRRTSPRHDPSTSNSCFPDATISLTPASKPR